MSDPSHAPEQDPAPIDAEFEPVKITTADTGLSIAPGWVAFCLLGLVSLASLGLALAAMGLFGTNNPAPPSGDEIAVQTDLQPVMTRLEALETRLATLTTTVDEHLLSQRRSDEDRQASLTRLQDLEDAVSRLETLTSAENFGQGTGEPTLLLGRLDRLETGLSRLENQQSSVAGTAALEVLQTELTALRAELSDLRTGEADIELRQAAAVALMAVNVEATRGRPFLLGYQQLRAALPDDSRVLALEPYATRGVPTLEQLETSFAEIEQEALAIEAENAAVEPGWVDQLFGDSVRVRRTAATPLSDALLAARTSLESGEIESALSELSQLDDAPKALFSDWMADARGRVTLNRALDSLRLMVMSRGQP